MRFFNNYYQILAICCENLAGIVIEHTFHWPTSVCSPECSDDSLLRWFLVRISRICPDVSFQPLTHPLNCDVGLKQPSTRHMFCKNMAWELILSGVCSYIEAGAFARTRLGILLCMSDKVLCLYQFLWLTLSFLIF